jgi:hypothetical protein
MRITELLCEDYRLLTRDARGNWLHGAEAILDDIHQAKTILKQSPNYVRGYEPTPTLTVYPEIFDQARRNEYALELDGDYYARMHETYEGEGLPIVRFLLSRWPDYAEFDLPEQDCTLGEYAKSAVWRLQDQDIWYHGTTSIQAKGILRLGLMPQGVSARNYRGLGGSETGLVYLGSSESTAEFHAENAAKHFGGAPVVLAIDLKGLEANIVDDHDVRTTSLGQNDHDYGDISTRRIKRRGGESSYRALGTIAYRGRIPPTRIKVIWQGKERAGARQQKAEHFDFVDKLSTLAKTMNKNLLYDLFLIIGLSPSGWDGSKVRFDDRYYTDPEKTINSVYQKRTQPKAFASWIRGMQKRGARWRKAYAITGNEAIGAVLKLIAEELARLQS